MSFNRLVTIFTILALFVITTLLFQNCGRITTVANYSLSSLWFEYPYNEKPELYAELYFYRPPSNNNNTLYDYTFLGAIAPSEGENTGLSYIVTFKDRLGRTVCPTITGYSTSIHSSCVGVLHADSIMVEMTVTYNQRNHIFRKIF